MRSIQLLRVLSMVIGSLTLLLAGCAGGIIPASERERADLITTASYQELEQHIETRGKDTSAAKTSELFPLCLAYSKTKRYNKLFPCLDRLEQNIRRGDKLDSYGHTSSDISPMPHLLRAEAYMELQDYDRALKEAEKAYLIVPSGYTAGWYPEKLLRIHALATLSLVHAFRGDRASAEKYRRLLEGLEISRLFDSVSMEDHRRLALAKIYMSLGEFTAVLEKLKNESVFSSFAKGLTNFVILGGSSHSQGKSLFAYTDLPYTFIHQKGKPPPIPRTPR